VVQLAAADTLELGASAIGEGAGGRRRGLAHRVGLAVVERRVLGACVVARSGVGVPLAALASIAGRFGAERVLALRSASRTVVLAGGLGEAGGGAVDERADRSALPASVVPHAFGVRGAVHLRHMAVQALLRARVLAVDAHLVRRACSGAADAGAGLLADSEIHLPHARGIGVARNASGVGVLALLLAAGAGDLAERVGAAVGVRQLVHAAAEAGGRLAVPLANGFGVAGRVGDREVAGGGADLADIVKRAGRVSVASSLVGAVLLQAGGRAGLIGGVQCAHVRVLLAFAGVTVGALINTG